MPRKKTFTITVTLKTFKTFDIETQYLKLRKPKRKKKDANAKIVVNIYSIW